MEPKARNIVLKDNHEKLPPVEFVKELVKEIPVSHFLSKEDFVELDEKGYIIKDHYLGENKLHQVWEEAKTLLANGKLSPAGMGTGGEHWQSAKARSDLVIWLNTVLESSWDNQGIEAIRSLIKNLDEIRLQLNEDINFNSDKFQSHLTCYPGEGARYMRHIDAYKGASTRRLTLLYYLNPDWKKGDGGELRIYHPNNNQDELSSDIEPIGDRLVIFQSRVLEHEVLPTYIHRYALTVWFY